MKSIYDTVVEALAANPQRKFIAVEMAYFYKWWQIADLGQKLITKKVRDDRGSSDDSSYNTAMCLARCERAARVHCWGLDDGG